MMQRRSSPLGLELVIPAMMLFMLFPLLIQAAPLQDMTEIQQYTEGCYYNYNHYNEGDRILTNEPCLNCTCYNKMLMCYLRVCPFTKPIGHDCVVEKREDQCCPIITCPEVPVDVAHHIPEPGTELSIPEKYGCSIEDRFYPEGAQVPSNPNKPCELCYCIKNRTSCLMQECTLHIDGCQPIYNKGSCCPVRYNCDHENDILELEDHSTSTTTTVRPTPGFILTTTMTPAVSTECIHNGKVYADGASLLGENSCEHCYCMRGDIVCAVQECEMPMLAANGKACQPLPPSEGECCPSNYVCESDTATTANTLYDITTASYADGVVKDTTTSPIKDLHSSVSIEDLQLQKHIDDDEQLPTEANKIDQSRPTSEDKIDRDGHEVTLSPVFPSQAHEETSTTMINSISEESYLADKNMLTTTSKHDAEKASSVYEKEEDQFESATSTDTPLDTTNKNSEEDIIDTEDKIETIAMVADDLLDNTTETLLHGDDEIVDLDISTTKPEDFDSIKDEVGDKIKTKPDEETVSSEPDSSTTTETLGNKDIMDTIVNIDTVKSTTIIPFNTEEMMEPVERIEVTTIKINSASDKSTTVPVESNIQVTTTKPEISVNTDNTQAYDGSGSDTDDVISMIKPVVFGDETQIFDSNDETRITSSTLKPIHTSNEIEDSHSTTISSQFTRDKESNATPAADILEGPEQQTTYESTPIIENNADHVTLPEEITTSYTEILEVSDVDESLSDKRGSSSEEIPTSLADNSSATTDKNVSTEQSTPISILPDETTSDKVYDMETIPTAIPGEGHCLVGQKTYQHSSLVPSSDKCVSSCRCLNSIVVCEPIQCEHPKDVEKCTYEKLGSDGCCPTYVCEIDSATGITDDILAQIEINKEEDKLHKYPDTGSILTNENEPELSNAFPTEITLSTMATEQPMSHIKHENNDENVSSTTYIPYSDISTHASTQELENQPGNNQDAIMTNFEPSDEIRLHEADKTQFDDEKSQTTPFIVITESEDLTTESTESPVETHFSSEIKKPETGEEGTEFFSSTYPSEVEKLDASEDSTTKRPIDLNETDDEVNYSNTVEVKDDLIEKPFNNEGAATDEPHKFSMTDLLITTSYPITNDQSNLSTVTLATNEKVALDKDDTIMQPIDEDKQTAIHTDNAVSDNINVTSKVPIDQYIKPFFDEHLLESSISPNDEISFETTTLSNSHVSPLKGTYTDTTPVDNNKISHIIPEDLNSEATPVTPESMQTVAPPGEDKETTPEILSHSTSPSTERRDDDSVENSSFQTSIQSTTEKSVSEHVQKIPPRTVSPMEGTKTDQQNDTSFPPKDTKDSHTTKEADNSGIPDIVQSSDLSQNDRVEETISSAISNPSDNEDFEETITSASVSESDMEATTQGLVVPAYTEVDPQKPQSTEEVSVDASTEEADAYVTIGGANVSKGGAAASELTEESNVSVPIEEYTGPEPSGGVLGAESTEDAIPSKSTQGESISAPTEESNTEPGKPEGTTISTNSEDSYEQSTKTEENNMSSSTEAAVGSERTEVSDALESTEKIIIKPTDSINGEDQIINETSQTISPTIDAMLISGADNKSHPVEDTLSQTPSPIIEKDIQENYDEDKTEHAINIPDSESESPSIEYQTDITEILPETMSQAVDSVAVPVIPVTDDEVSRTDEIIQHEYAPENIDIDMSQHEPIVNENKDVIETMSQTVIPHLDDVSMTEDENTKDDKFSLQTDAPSVDNNIKPIHNQEAHNETNDGTNTDVVVTWSDDKTHIFESGMEPTDPSLVYHTVAPHSEVGTPLLPHDLHVNGDPEKEETTATPGSETQTGAPILDDLQNENEDKRILQAATEDNENNPNIVISTIGHRIGSPEETTEHYINPPKEDKTSDESAKPHGTDFINMSENNDNGQLFSTESPDSGNDMDKENNQENQSTPFPINAFTSESNNKKITEAQITTTSASETQVDEENLASTTMPSETNYDKGEKDSTTHKTEETPSSEDSTVNETIEVTARPVPNDENKIPVDNLSTKPVSTQDEMITTSSPETSSSSSSPVESEVEQTTDKLLVESPTLEGTTEQAPEDFAVHSNSPFLNANHDIGDESLSQTTESVIDTTSQDLLAIDVDFKDDDDKYSTPSQAESSTDINENAINANDNFSKESEAGHDYHSQFITVQPAFDTSDFQNTLPEEEQEIVKEELLESFNSQTASPITEEAQKEPTENDQPTTTSSLSLQEKDEVNLNLDKNSTVITENLEHTTPSTAGQDKERQTEVFHKVSSTEKSVVMDTTSSTTDRTVLDTEDTLGHTGAYEKEHTSLEPQDIQTVSHHVTTENILLVNEEQRETTAHIPFDDNTDQSITVVETEKPMDGILATTDYSSVNLNPITVGIPTDIESIEEHTPFTLEHELPSKEENVASPNKDGSDVPNKPEDESLAVSPSVTENLNSIEETDESIESEEEISSDPNTPNIQHIGQFVTDHVDDTFTESPSSEENEDNQDQQTFVQKDNEKQIYKKDEVPSITSSHSITQTSSSPIAPGIADSDEILDSLSGVTEYPKDLIGNEITQIIPVNPTISPESLHKHFETTTTKEEKYVFTEIPVVTFSHDLHSSVESIGEESSEVVNAVDSSEEFKESAEQNANDADSPARTTSSPMHLHDTHSTTLRPIHGSDLGAHTSTGQYGSTVTATEKINRTTTTTEAPTTPTRQDPYSTTVSSTQYSQPPTSYGGQPHQYPSYPEDEYTDEDETEVFGPGTCRYGGKLFVSAQQIPRDDPCDFCFCFRSDIICLQQSCPPPISGCHEEPISGFCCPRYECPVSMATVLNITTSTTTTSTTLPPHFLHHAYQGAAEKNGCHINGRSYRVGEKIDATSGPCMHCACGGDGQMKCDPKTCSPEPMLQQMIAVVASRRR